MLQGHRPSRARVTLKDASPIPRPPAELPEDARSFWRTAWSSSAARAWDPKGDRLVVARYAAMLALWWRCRTIIHTAPLTKGSTGQPVANPVWVQLHSLEKSLRTLEDVMGLNLMARYRMLLTDANTKKTLQELLDEDDADLATEPSLEELVATLHERGSTAGG